MMIMFASPHGDLKNYTPPQISQNFPNGALIEADLRRSQRFPRVRRSGALRRRERRGGDRGQG